MLIQFDQAVMVVVHYRLPTLLGLAHFGISAKLVVLTLAICSPRGRRRREIEQALQAQHFD